MRDLITVSWITTRDVDSLIADSTSLADAITQVSYDIAELVGHDFGDSTAAEESFDGVVSPNLYFAGVTEYPLRTLTSITADGFDVPVQDVYLRQYTDHATGRINRIRLKSGSWNADTVKVLGDWGWEDTPDEVKEAIFRILVLRITGDVYGGQDQSTTPAIKSLKHPDGISIEYAVNDESITRKGFGDDFADSIINKYVWERGAWVA